ncbi:PilZ domain-containing protein [Planctomycetes bacterium K23_9]|uniref:PilZ domain protein n=1 Tax=Stieleria marina TaxID=1930275 RepID=A0A517NSD1_9BACT|nr:PilZ domain protein [Planctomycetes bacterium K23_9]
MHQILIPPSGTPSGLATTDVDQKRHALIPGLIILPGDSSQQFTPCFMLDFSKDHCLLRVDVSYTLKQRDILIRVLDTDDDQKIELVGRVTASRRHTIDTTTFVCEFGQQLPPHVLAMMNQIAIVDRRTCDRNECLVRVSVCRIERGQVVSQASLVEASGHGLRLRTEVPLDIGEQVVVSLPSGEDILVAIVWSKEVNGTNQTGASLTTASVESTVLHSVHRLSKQ